MTGKALTTQPNSVGTEENLNPSLPDPFMSVLIRSYNRLPHLLEILEVCMTQEYDRFEVIVVEQSTPAHWESHRAALERFDSRVKVVRSKRLRPPGARNVGVAHCKGDIILFIDNDDLPIGNDWITGHAKNYADPLCIGVSGRQVHQINEKPHYKDMERAYKRCLTRSFFLRGRKYIGVNRVKKHVQWLHGTNCSLRKSTIINLGGWYPHLNARGEEHSLFYKFQRTKKPGEYLMFDPQPKILRRFDIAGGVERHTMSFHTILIDRMQYYHWVIAEYYPLRFYGLYPFFLLYGFNFSLRYFRHNSSFNDVFWIRVFGQKSGQHLYILQELLKLPIMALRFLVTRKPVWDGHIAIPEGEQVNEV